MRELDRALESFSGAVGIWEKHPPAVSNRRIARALIYRGLTRERAGDAAGARLDFSRAVDLKDMPPECRELLALSPAWTPAQDKGSPPP
jgi:hypothetical protein